jgi:hypothetical protein
MRATEAVPFRGELIAVKARIRLVRSFDQVHHQYQGYTLVLAAAIGPATQSKLQFRIGDIVSGMGHPVPDPKQEWAGLNRVSKLQVERRGPAEQNRAPDPDGGIAPHLEVYRANGHRRLDPRTCQMQCERCPWGLTMITEIVIDQWNPSKKRWRTETHCYGPRDCPRYRAGKPRTVQGHKPGMVWVDDDADRE